jgi:hypothetical protein
MALACYTNATSAWPGDRITLHGSSSNPNCSLEIARIGQARDVVLRIKHVTVGQHEIPPHADREGCGWPAALSIEIGLQWRSGYYDLRLRNAAGDDSHHFFCLKPRRGEPRSRAALVLSTNTYHAYNWWGGANAYCDVSSLMSRSGALPQAMQGAIGVLSTQRPFAPLIVAAPEDTPRLVNTRARRYLERPWAGNRDWARAHRLHHTTARPGS